MGYRPAAADRLFWIQAVARVEDPAGSGVKTGLSKLIPCIYTCDHGVTTLSAIRRHYGHLRLIRFPGFPACRY